MIFYISKTTWRKKKDTLNNVLFKYIIGSVRPSRFNKKIKNSSLG